jgi:SAM-dependent methyltransferase
MRPTQPTHAEHSRHLHITSQELYELFLLKHGDPVRSGWSPRRRLSFGYYEPADYYEALVHKLVTTETDWVDVGGGGALFPDNRPLSQLLSERAHRITVVDPSDNIDSGSFAHERVQCLIEEYQTHNRFDLATLRMVAEHIVHPSSVLDTLNRLLRQHGKVIIFTVNRWSPVTLLSNILPFSLHHPIKKIFWTVEEDDTFPTVYRMNTRQCLRTLFTDHGFQERYFAYLDDLSVLSRFKILNYVELFSWRILKGLRIRYPENCLLGVYEKTQEVS